MNGYHYVKNKKIMETITKEEMIEILKENIDWLRHDVSDIHHDIRDYESLGDEGYDYIADGILHDIQYVLSKKRSIKIKKIKERL